MHRICKIVWAHWNPARAPGHLGCLTLIPFRRSGGRRQHARVRTQIASFAGLPTDGHQATLFRCVLGQMISLFISTNVFWMLC